MELRTICEKSEEAESKLGKDIARKLQSRLADLVSIENIEEMLLGNPTAVKENGFEACKINIINDAAMLVIANHIRTPLSYSNRMDWDKISRIKIVKITGNGRTFS